MVDTGDLKSPGHCDRAGSSPVPGTKYVLVTQLVKQLPFKEWATGSNPGGNTIYAPIAQ